MWTPEGRCTGTTVGPEWRDRGKCCDLLRPNPRDGLIFLDGLVPKGRDRGHLEGPQRWRRVPDLSHRSTVGPGPVPCGHEGECVIGSSDLGAIGPPCVICDNLVFHRSEFTSTHLPPLPVIDTFNPLHLAPRERSITFT